MRDKPLLWILIAVIMLGSAAYAAYAFDYFTYRMNFPPGESRSHTQQINFSGNLTITLPSGFSFSSSTHSYTTSGNNYTWQSNTTITMNYTITSQSNCTEGTIYESKIYNNGTFIDDFVYVCINDENIVDYKVEYGHGCGNYLAKDEPYISNETAALFNLVRVWNIGSYLDPDEDVANAEIKCFYERHPVRTYGRVDVKYEPTRINGTFHWDRISGGYWFRIGVLSQEVSGKSIGDFYSVNCTELTYYFEHERVVASFPNYSLEVRSTNPLIKNTSASNNKEIVTIKNIEKYPVYNLMLDFIVNGFVETNHLPRLGPGETITYYADTGTNVTASFVPSWLRNCFTPVYYSQLLLNITNITINNPPAAANIPSFAWVENTSYDNAFDLDNYFSDPENDTLTFGYTGTVNINVTIDNTTNNVSFSQPANWTGIDYVVFYANDGNSTTYSNNITLVVYPANITIQNITIIQNITQIISGGGGGGGRIECPPSAVCPVIPEECREVWICRNWSECYPEGIRNRTCWDLNECGTELFKPVAEENCTPEIIVPPFEEIVAPSEPVCKICLIIPALILALLILLIFLLSPKRRKKSESKKNEVLKWRKAKL